jgi:hypothetical protein
VNLARMAVKAWPRTEYTPRATTRHLRREWMRKIELLGPKWLLHPSNQVARKV